MKRSVLIRAIVFQEGEWLSAQCLEYDFATQARTLDALAQELQRLIVGHIATSLSLGKAPFAGIPQAPRRFFEMFERSRIPLKATQVEIATTTSEIEVAPPELRAFAALVPA